MGLISRVSSRTYRDFFISNLKKMRRGTVQLFNVARQTRASLSTTAVAANLKTDSFIQGLYTNQLVTEHVFPFPMVLDEERLENLSMTVDATQTFFDEVNDADANDRTSPSVRKHGKVLKSWALSVYSYLKNMVVWP